MPLLYCAVCGKGGLRLQDPRCDACGQAAKVDGRIVMLADRPSNDYSVATSAVQEDVAQQHVWFQLRTDAILDETRSLMRRGGGRFVDFGCGNGQVMEALERQGWETLGVDMHVEALRRAQTRTRGMLVCSRILRTRLIEKADAAGLFDVIEHAPDDLAVLQHVRDQLAPGGSVVVTVPAMRALWSQFDVLLGHKRRYSRRMLRDVLERAGFACVDARYCFGFVVPGIWLHRRMLARRPSARRAYYARPPVVLNAAFRALARVEMALARRSIRLPFGSSLIAIGRRA